ncbi:MAG: hypothetical protein NTW87_26795 [Planctomycetota bacterium]|nr:hypothetical protein [Planctomycetota bacterium]
MMRAFITAALLLCASSFFAADGAARDDKDWRKSIGVLDDYFKALERRVSLELTNEPLEEAMNFVNSLTKVNIELLPEPESRKPPGEPRSAKQKVTLKFVGVPVWVVFDRLLKEAKLDWTIAPGDQMVCVQVGSSEKIAEIEKKYPDFAKKVREYREKNSEKK